MSRGHGGTWGQQHSAMAPALMRRRTCGHSYLQPPPAQLTRSRAMCIQCLAGNWALTPAGAFRPHWNKKRIVPPIGMGAHTNLLVQEIHLPGGLARREVPQDHITQPHHPAHHSARPLGAPPVLPKPNPKNHENNFLDGQKSRRPVNSHTIACAPCI